MAFIKAVPSLLVLFLLPTHAFGADLVWGSKGVREIFCRVDLGLVNCEVTRGPVTPPANAVVRGVYLINYDLIAKSNLAGYGIDITHAGLKASIADVPNGIPPAYATPANPQFKFYGQPLGTIETWRPSIRVLRQNPLLDYWGIGFFFAITWEVPPQGLAPAVSELLPITGSGNSTTLTATFGHTGGDRHYLAYLLALPTPNITNYTATGSCLIEYNRVSNGVRLINDQGTGWLGGQSGVPIQPGAQSLANSFCTVDVARVEAFVSGGLLRVLAPVTFKNTFGPILATFLQAFDVHGAYTGMTQFGNWFLPAVPQTKSGPYIMSFSPMSGAGSSMNLSVSTRHMSGASSIREIHILLSQDIVGGAPCHVIYVPAAKAVNLVNEQGTALVSPSFRTANSGDFGNGRCTVDTAGMNTLQNGEIAGFGAQLRFNTTTFAGPKNVYVNVFDYSSLLSHWHLEGYWTVN